MAKILETAMDLSKFLLGMFSTLSFLLFIILSTPVYLFRYFVLILAKVYRPDLDEMLSGHSAVFANDYFAETPASRTNIVVTLIIDGRVTLQEARTTVMSKWIQAEDEERRFKKFQQYPERWLGFTFWKKKTSFSIENHVLLAFDENKLVNKKELNYIVEKLLNSHLPKNQSPWQVYLIENYSDPGSETQCRSAIIFKAHHALADGYSILSAVVEGICDYSVDNVKLASPQIIQGSLVEKLSYMLTFPFAAFWELSHVLSHRVKPTPWKIPDNRKEWYQVCAKSAPISIQTVKDIKNHFGVSFTSVLLSSISAAIHKSLKASNTEQFTGDSMLCFSPLPVIGQGTRRKLTNELTAALFSIPSKSFQNPVKRLRNVDDTLKRTKESVLPVVVRYFVAALGAHVYGVCEPIMKNRATSTSLTNFPGVLSEVSKNGKRAVDVDFVAGGLQGNLGLGIMALSYDEHIRVAVAVEKALMSRKEANQFLKYLTDEIQLLHSLMRVKQKLY